MDFNKLYGVLPIAARRARTLVKFYANRFRSSYSIIRGLLHQELIFQGLVPCYRQLIERTRPFYFRGL